MSKYPGEFDTNEEIPAVNDNITEVGGQSINGLRSAVFAIEAALGSNPQGSAASLSSRLASVLNDDGTFKAAALIASGLIALPITNTQIGASAAIQESKLDLDISTQSLQNQISSNNVDILALQDSLADDIVDLSQHISGLISRHDGYDIDIAALTGQPLITTVGAALDFIWNTFLGHRISTTAGEHNASAITFNPSGLDTIVGTDVQTAISEIETAFVEDRRKHNDSAHSDGVSGDGYTLLSGQADTNDSSLCLTRYQTFAGGADIIKIGHPNAASVKTKGFQPGAIISTTSEFNIVAAIGTGITRTLAITALHTAVYPPASTRVTLQAVVDYINAQAATTTNHFPVSAFASADGELVLQHNIDRSDCTLRITAGAQSAISALGFSNVVGNTISGADAFFYTINGQPFDELKVLATGSRTQAGTSSVVDIGTDVVAAGLFINSLFHVFNHSTASANGTYRISQISPASPSPSTSIGLSTTLDAGTFSFVIYADCFSTNFSGSPKVLDFYLDSNQDPVVSTRGTITFGGLGGVKIVELSQDFPLISSGSFTLATSGARKSLVINDGSSNGITTLFDSGFLGYVRVWAPDNKAFATCLITDLAPVNGTDSISTIATQASDDRILLGASHTDSSAIIELPLDRRNIGLVGNSAIGSEFIRGTLERDITNFHTSGVVRGLEASTSTTTIIAIEGGSAYVGGHHIIKTDSLITIVGVPSDGDYNLVINKSGTFEIYANSGGFSLRNLLFNNDFLILARIAVSSSTIESITDARIFTSNTEAKLALTVDTRDGFGIFKTLEASLIYVDADNTPQNINGPISVLSTITVSDISFADDIQVIFYDNVTFSGALTLNSRVVIEIYGTATFAGAVTIGAGSQLILHSTSTFSSSVTCGASSLLQFYAASSVGSLILSGAGAQIFGSGARPILTFPGSATGVAISAANIRFNNLSFYMPDAAFTLIDLQSGADGFIATDCLFKQNYAINETNWSTAARAGIKILATNITIADVIIQNCVFDNFAEAISGSNVSSNSNTWDNWLIDGCLIKNCGIGIYPENIENSRITNNLISFIKFNHIKLADVSTSQKNSIIANNVFELQSTTSTTLTCVSISDFCDTITISNNIFRDFTGVSAIAISSSTNTPRGIVISGNIITDCTTNDNYAFNLANARQSLLVANNIMVNHTGNAMSATDATITGNNFTSSYNLATIPALKITNSTTQPFVSGNIFAITTNQNMHISGSASIVGNSITTNFITVDGLAAIGFNMSDNLLDATGTGATTSISIDTSATYIGKHTFSNNVVRVAATTNGLLLSLGRFLIGGNSFTAPAGNVPDKILTIGNGTTDASAIYLVEGNLIEAGSGSDYGILIATDHVSIVGNTIYGAGMANQAIFAQSGNADICIENNFLGGASNGLLITHADATPSNFHIGFNKNYTDNIDQASVMAAQASGTWSITSNTLRSAVSATAVLSLLGLPIGSQLVSVSLSSTTTTIGGLSGRILKRTSGSTATSNLSSTTSTTGTGHTTITIVPTSSEYIQRNSDYLLLLTSVSGTNDVAQVVVNVKY